MHNVNILNLYYRDGSRFSNIRFNYRISIRLCDYFLKVYQGLTIKTVQWPGDSVKDDRICHLPDRPLHEFV